MCGFVPWHTILPVDPHDCFVIVALWCCLSRQFFSLLNYENMLIHLQETWKIQNKLTYSFIIYYNCFLSG